MRVYAARFRGELKEDRLKVGVGHAAILSRQGQCGNRLIAGIWRVVAARIVISKEAEHYGQDGNDDEGGDPGQHDKNTVQKR